jgi:hypothetical protein
LSRAVSQRWFSVPDFICLLPIPLVTLGAVLFAGILLGRPPIRLLWGKVWPLSYG